MVVVVSVVVDDASDTDHSVGVVDVANGAVDVADAWGMVTSQPPLTVVLWLLLWALLLLLLAMPPVLLWLPLLVHQLATG